LILRRNDDDFVGAVFGGSGYFDIGRKRDHVWKDLQTCQFSEPYDGFFEFAFAAVGDRLFVYANGRKILEARDDAPPDGPMSVGVGSKASPDGVALFRDIEVQVLDKPSAQGEGFVPLFNGKDLTGWKTHPSQPGNWRVENGVLIGSGPATSHLYSERGDYKDFHLRVEARINDNGNSGLIFRALFGPGRPINNPQWPLGYEAQINSTHSDPRKTGSLFAADAGAVVTVKESPVPAGEWFTEEVVAEGNHIVVKVNGKTTAEYTDDKRQFTGGHLVLQQLYPETVAEFRKIEIKELDKGKVTTTESGLKYEDLEEGTGETAKKGDVVEVHYTGWLTDGRKFDSSLDRGQPFRFELGAGKVVKGWEEGVPGMKVGGKRKLTIPPELGYGTRGAGNGAIPPNATLVFEIELLRINAPPSPKPEEQSFVPLFNGKDLTGWAGLEGFWSVKDGTISGHETRDGSKQTDLVLTTMRPTDFELHYSYKFATPDGNSGVQFRSKVLDDKTYHVGGYQADCDAKSDYNGSVYDEAGVAGGRRTMSNRGEKTIWDADNQRHDERLPDSGDELKKYIKVGDWNDCVVVAKGDHITYTINGRLMTDLTDDSPKALKEGVIALQLHQGFTMEVLFKDIKIKVLPPPKPDSESFVPLFNGKDLTGWKTHPSQAGNWRVANGILTGSGPATSHLYSERGDYKDFHLRAEARINDGGHGGVFFRTASDPVAPVDKPTLPAGYMAVIDSTFQLNPNKTGSLYARGPGYLVTVRESPAPAGEWFTLEVIAEGSHFVVKVNGKTTADYTDPKRTYTAGSITLEQFWQQTAIEFRKIEIKELK